MPNERVDLPGGQWAELRDPLEVSERERRPLKQAQFGLSRDRRKGEKPGDEAVTTPVAPQLGGPTKSAPSLSDEDFRVYQGFTDQLIAFFVASWSFDPAPSEDTLLDLPAAAYTALEKAVQPRVDVLFPEIAEARRKQEGRDAEDPTAP